MLIVFYCALFEQKTKKTRKAEELGVSDLIQLPKIDPSSSWKAKRRAPASAPSYHLTSKKCLKFIEDADARQKEKDTKEKELDKIKKEAVKQAKQAKAKEQRPKQKTKPRRKAIPLHPRL